MKARLVDVRGHRLVEINGSIIPFTAYRSWRPREENLAAFNKRGFPIMTFLPSGIKNRFGIPYSAFGEYWIGEGKYDFALLDFHAEATSEKIAMGRYLDGRVSAVFGTHTHVQTADEQILPMGTAYITDLGMTGPTNGVLGVSYDIIISKFLTHMPYRFKVAEGECKAHGILIDVDENTGRSRSIKRIAF